MTSPSGGKDDDVCCQPGDITVTQLPAGYLVGRALERRGLGPWWTYILITSTYEEAVNHAHTLAASAGVRAWLHHGGENYEQLPDR